MSYSSQVRENFRNKKVKKKRKRKKKAFGPPTCRLRLLPSVERRVPFTVIASANSRGERAVSKQARPCAVLHILQDI